VTWKCQGDRLDPLGQGVSQLPNPQVLVAPHGPKL
jgi:hypothetical protein